MEARLTLNKRRKDSSENSSIRKLTHQEKKYFRKLAGAHSFISLQSNKGPQVLKVENHHPTRDCHVVVLTPQQKECMENFFHGSGSAGSLLVSANAAMEVKHEQRFELLEASDQYRMIPAGQADVFLVDPSRARLNGNRYTHVAVLFKENHYHGDHGDDDGDDGGGCENPFYFLAQLADVNAKQNALVIREADLENTVGGSVKPKVSLTMETNGKWNIHSYHGDEVIESTNKNNRVKEKASAMRMVLSLAVGLYIVSLISATRV